MSGDQLGGVSCNSTPEVWQISLQLLIRIGVPHTETRFSNFGLDVLRHCRYKNKCRFCEFRFGSINLCIISISLSSSRQHLANQTFNLMYSTVQHSRTHGYTWSVGCSTPPAPLRQPSSLRPATARKHSSHTNPSPQPKPHPRDVPSGPPPSFISKAAPIGKNRSSLI